MGFLGPRRAEMGNLAFVVAGATRPFVVRTTSDGRYTIVRGFDVCGIVYGEMLEALPGYGVVDIILL
jgi:hypothetical protein